MLKKLVKCVKLKDDEYVNLIKVLRTAFKTIIYTKLEFY